MKYYLIFHHNLAFSSIPSEHYQYIITNIYDRLLDIAEAGFPLGLEYTGETLETIYTLRPKFIDRLQRLLRQGHVELIGSSYSQAIFPLIPAEVNRWNLEFGLETYNQLLGIQPKIAFVNEQCYADSLCNLYMSHGYSAVIIDWMNACKGNNWPRSWRYHPLVHQPTGLRFLWNDCVSFQKFQRTVWGELDRKEWEDFLSLHEQIAKDSSIAGPAFALYGSDAEIFDYRPGSLETVTAAKGHLETIRQLLESMCAKSGTVINLPSRILEEAEATNLPGIDRVGTPSYPIRTKKQDKYNVTRWAVTGRASSRMNTQCFKLLDAIREMENRREAPGKIRTLQKELIQLWASDFRTHTTDEKIEIFRNKMGAALFQAHSVLSCDQETHTPPVHRSDFSRRAETTGRTIRVECGGNTLTLLKNRGLAIESFTSKRWGTLLGTIPHGYFSDISLSSDFYTGHTLLLTQDGRQHTDLSIRVPEVEIEETGQKVTVKNRMPMKLPCLHLNKSLTLDADSLTIRYDMYAKDLRPASLRLGICTLPPWSFDQNTLFYETSNGGEQPEHFLLGITAVLQDNPVNHTVTCSHCLGNVTGRLCIGDAEKHIRISTNLSELYSVPLLHYETMKDCLERDSYFLRVYYTICERDDVANVFWKGKMSISFKITPGGKPAKDQPVVCPSTSV